MKQALDMTLLILLWAMVLSVTIDIVGKAVTCG